MGRKSETTKFLRKRFYEIIQDQLIKGNYQEEKEAFLDLIRKLKMGKNDRRANCGYNLELPEHKLYHQYKYWKFTHNKS